MLKVFRDNLKYLSWILWIVIAVFVLFVFVDFGRVSNLRQRSSTAAASVGDQEITYGELQRASRNIEDRARQVYGDKLTPEVAKQMNFDRQALEVLVNEKIMVQEASRLGLRVSDSELGKGILRFPIFKDSQGKFVGKDVYAATVRRLGYTVSDFESRIRTDLLVEKLQNLLERNLYVSDAEVERTYREKVEKAKIRFVQLPAAELENQVAVSDAEVASYFDAHKADYRLPEQRKVGYLLVDVNSLRNQMQIDESELHQYYQEHQDEFKRPEMVKARHILVKIDENRTDTQARARAEEIKRKIERGADFAEEARTSSDDPGSASRGGELGYFPRGRMTPEFEKAAFAAKVGQLVGPVKTPFGYHLLEVEDRREGGLEPFAEARARIRARLASERVQTEAEKEAKDLSAEIKQDKITGEDGMQSLADSHPGVTFASPKAFGKDDFIPGLGRVPELSEAIFQLQPGSYSEPIRVARGWAIVRLDKIEPPRDRELAEVKDQIRRTLAHDKSQKMALDKLEAAKKEIAGGKTLDEVAKELATPVQESGEFTAQGTIPGLGFNASVAKAAMQLHEGEVGGPFETTSGTILFQVVERQYWDPAKFASEKDKTREQLVQQDFQRFLSSLLRDRRRELGVTIDPRLVKELGMGGEEART